MPTPKIRVVVVDDSAFMRKMVSDILSRTPDIEVAAAARNGREGLSQVIQQRPDVVTLDVEMPEVDGLEALKFIMQERPTPVVMLSSLTKEGADTTMRALQLGAVDFVHKPSGAISLDLDKVADEIVDKVRSAAQANIRSLSRPTAAYDAAPKPSPAAAKPRPSPTAAPGRFEYVVALGTSTGGPRALQEVIPRLPGSLPAPVVVVQHMPPKFTRSLAERLDSTSAVRVTEAEEGDALTPGHVLIAPGGRHMRVGPDRRIHLSDEPPLWGVRPAADYLLESVLEQFGDRTIGVILTGMGQDGCRAMRAIHAQGGQTIAESEETCVIYGMPRAVVEAGAADHVAPLHRVPDQIVTCLARGAAGRSADR